VPNPESGFPSYLAMILVSYLFSSST
jgi:hypothetical protein